LLGFRLFVPSILIILFLIIIGFYLTYISVNQEQQQRLVSARTTTLDYLNTCEEILNAAALVTNGQDTQVATKYLEQFLETNSHFYSFYIIDNQSRITSIAPQNQAFSQLDMSNQEYLVFPQEIKFHLSQPHISPLSGEKTIFAVTRLTDGGFLVGEINLHELSSILAEIEQNPNQSLQIMDDYGQVIVDVHKPSREIEDAPRRTVGQNQPTFSTPLSSSFPGLTGDLKMEQTSATWHLVTKTTIMDAFGLYLISSGAIFLIFLVFWMGLGALIRKDFITRIIAPLTNLSSTANALAEHNYSDPLHPTPATSSFMEMEELAGNFNRMTSAIRNREAAIRENEQKYRALIEQSNDAICLEVDGFFEIINQKFIQVFGIAKTADIHNEIDFMHLVAPQSCAFVHVQRQRLLQRNVLNARYEFSAINRMGEEIEVEASCSVFPYQGGTALQTILRDITDRKRAERAEHEQRVLAEALRDTASALNSTLNFDEVMVRILSNIGRVVPHDSSNIMLIDDDGDTVRIVASQGYNLLGLEGYQERVALSIRGTESLSHMYDCGEPLVVSDTTFESSWINLPETSWIHSYAAAPIKVKDKIIGFLNLNSPIPNFFNRTMADRLMAFADQAGIAINNARLLRDLNLTNIELRNSYDKTLQGWSMALELRDYETEGHSQRVVDLTLQLANKMGISEPDLTWIRYGVLLHDIGKIGIPDRILFKPGALDADEWEIMRRHPEYAMRILKPIPYLEKSIDIPYCHHEKWDGSGYPRGLRGEEIPLAARMFSIIDVWDGMRSNRPYHRSYSFDHVAAYIKKEAGKQFDPHIVELFLDLIQSDQQYNVR